MNMMSSEDTSKPTPPAYGDDLPAYDDADRNQPPLPSYNDVQRISGTTTSTPNLNAPEVNSNGPTETPTHQVPPPPRRRQLTTEEHLQLLREFQWEKEHANDYWGGQKGSASGPPKDPFKVFRWAARKMSRDEDPLSRPPGSPERWYDRSRSEVPYAKDGEVAKGDIDTSNLAG
jgi:hypothetical protein